MALATGPFQFESKAPRGPIAVITAEGYPRLSNTGAASALMPGVISPAIRDSPRALTAASNRSARAMDLMKRPPARLLFNHI